MWYSLVFILVVFIAVFIGFTERTLAKDNSSLALDELSRVELNQKLEHLPHDLEKWDKPVGAMCYKTAAPPQRVEYICPVCGEMTLYPSYSSLSFSVDNVLYYRTLVKQITKLDVKLDESELCEKCNPAPKARKLCLIVKFDSNSTPYRTCDITEEDIKLLYEYSEGEKEHDTSVVKFPITDYKNRLEEMLGVEIKDNGK